MNNNGNALPHGCKRLVSPASGKVTFQVVAGSVRGSKIRKNFGELTYGSEQNALAAASRWLDAKRAEIRRDGSNVLSITDHERLSYSEALKRLSPYGKTLLEAVDAATGLWNKEKKPSVTFAAARKAFLEFKTIEDCSPDYRKDLYWKLAAFSELDSRQVHEITAQDLTEGLVDREMGAVSWNNWRRCLTVFFNWCMEKKEWIAKNPANAIPQKKTDDQEVEILTVAQTKRLLGTASHSFPRLVPWLVLGLFAGLRRDEAQSAQWEDIDFEHGVIKVRAGKVRSLGTRYVELTAPARAFLEPLKATGPIATGVATRRSDLRVLAELTEIDCSKNLYRHSFGSYHVAAHQDNQKTMFQMGHGNLKTFVQWYRRPIPRLVAEAYWQLMPSALR